VEPKRTVEGANVWFERQEYVEEKKQKVIEGDPTVLDLLDLLWFEGDVALDFVEKLSKQLKETIASTWKSYEELVPEENRTAVTDLIRRLPKE
jgi:hypothetical protein